MHILKIDDHIEGFQYSSKHKYTKFKKGKRLICSPNEPLRGYQYTIKNWLENTYKFSDHITGFRKGISIYDNAKIHHGQEYIMTIDIVDFFGSIKIHHLYEAIKPLGLTNFNKLLEFISFEGKLPQGSPSSPILSNIIFQKHDDRIINLLKEIEPTITYSRYVDDISIGYKNKELTTAILHTVQNILLQSGFRINYNKYNVFQKGKHQKVTGMIISESHVGIGYRKYRIARKIIYYHLSHARGYYPSIKGMLLYIKGVDFYRFNQLKEVFKGQFFNSQVYQELFNVDEDGNPWKKGKKFFRHSFNHEIESLNFASQEQDFYTINKPEQINKKCYIKKKMLYKERCRSNKGVKKIPTGFKGDSYLG